MKAGSERCDKDREIRRKRRCKVKKKGAWRNEKRREGGGGGCGAGLTGPAQRTRQQHSISEGNPPELAVLREEFEETMMYGGSRLELTGRKVDEGDQSFPCNQIDCVSDP